MYVCMYYNGCANDVLIGLMLLWLLFLGVVFISVVIYCLYGVHGRVYCGECIVYTVVVVMYRVY